MGTATAGLFRARWGRIGRMSEARKKADRPIVVALVLAVFLAATAIYAGCYFAMANGFEVGAVGAFRYYDSDWKARVFAPAATIETVITRRRVSTMSTDSYHVFP